MGILTRLSGQIIIASAGTAVQGPAVKGEIFDFMGDPSNTGVTYVGNDGADDVSATTGFPLTTSGLGASLTLHVKDLSDLWFDAAAGGDGDIVAWIRVAA